MKAQSAIEYLITYGWMLIGVSIIGGGLYQFAGNQCQVQVEGLQGADIVAADSALDSDNQLTLAFRSSSNREITVRQVDVGNGSVVQMRDIILEPGETRPYAVANTNRTEECSTMDIQVTYDIGPVNSQKYYGELTAPAELIDAVVDLLSVSGGKIDRLEVQSTIKPSYEDICVGDQCSLTESGDEEYVNRSGDQMTGYLEVKELEFNCFGDQCADEAGTLPGYVSYTNNTMDGTLEITEINRNGKLCLGRCK